MFHYVLLDWGDNKQFMRQFLLTRNVILPNQQAMQATLDNWLGQNPRMINVYRRDLRGTRQERRRGRGLNN